MSGIQRLQGDRRMSQIVIHKGIAYLSGQVADSWRAPVEVQTAEILARIDTLLAEAGTDRTNLLTAQIWLADPREFAAMNAVWEEWVPTGSAPTRATCAPALCHEHPRVEITVTAALP